MSVWVVCLTLAVLPVSLWAACADLPATGTVNCSFDPHEVCSGQYIRTDEHGINWQQAQGSLYTEAGDDVMIRGHGLDWYLYMAGTTDSRREGLWLGLVSPTADIDDGCLMFSLHNSVSDPRPTFKVLLRAVDGLGQAEDAEVYDDVGILGDTSWSRRFVPLNGFGGKYQVVFSTMQQRQQDQAVAVSAVVYSPRPCAITDSAIYHPGDCDFEDEFCGYENWRETKDCWQIVPAEPIPDRPTGYSYRSNPLTRRPMLRRKGKVMALWRAPRNKHEFNISSPQMTIAGESCLALNYFSGRPKRYNQNQPFLAVSQRFDNNTVMLLHDFPATFSAVDSDWQEAWIVLPRGNYSLVFTARVERSMPYNHDVNDFVAFDDVEIHQTPCSLARCGQVLCDDRHACDKCIGRGRKHRVCGCFPGPECPSTAREVKVTRRRTVLRPNHRQIFRATKKHH